MSAQILVVISYHIICHCSCLLCCGVSVSLLEAQLHQLPLEGRELSGMKLLAWKMASLDPLVMGGVFGLYCFILIFYSPSPTGVDDG